MEGQSASLGQPAALEKSAVGERRWLVFVLFLVCLINYADRSVVNAVAEPLRREFGLSLFQVGILSGLSFALLYSGLGLPFARLAERFNRVRIIAAATLVWSLMTVLCGTATSYIHLALMRLGVGVGEAGFMAPASSLLGDRFPKERRAFVTSMMMLGVPFGALLGAMSGGIIAQNLGWRWAFIIMGLPGILIALLVWTTVREPQRGTQDAHAGTDIPPFWTVFRQCFANRTFVHVLMGGLLGGFGLHGLGGFLGVYFNRVHGLPYSTAGMIYGLQTFASVGGGLLISGFLANRLGKRSLRWNSLLPAIGMSLCVPIYIVAFSVSDLTVAVTLIITAGICLVMHYGPSVAIVQNLATPRTRATTIAVYQLCVNVVSMGLGPMLIGLVGDVFSAQLTPELGKEQALGTGLRYALMASTVFYAWGAIHYFLAQRGEPMAR
jgi:MFS family permease